MSLPQIRAALAGCDRRDAALAIRGAKSVHAGMAPVMVGEKGRKAYEEFIASMMRIIVPPVATQSQGDWFDSLWSSGLVSAEDKVKAGFDPLAKTAVRMPLPDVVEKAAEVPAVA